MVRSLIHSGWITLNSSPHSPLASAAPCHNSNHNVWPDLSFHFFLDMRFARRYTMHTSCQLVFGVFNHSSLCGMDKVLGPHGAMKKSDAEGIERQWASFCNPLGHHTACREHSGWVIAHLWCSLKATAAYLHSVRRIYSECYCYMCSPYWRAYSLILHYNNIRWSKK